MSASLLSFFRNIWEIFMSLFGFGLRRQSLTTPGLLIYVRTNLGEKVCMNLQPSWTIKQVKENLEEKLNSPKNSLRIIFAGKELPDELCIQDCDLGNHSILHAIRVAGDKTSVPESVSLEGGQQDNQAERSECAAVLKNSTDYSSEDVTCSGSDKYAAANHVSGDLSAADKKTSVRTRLLCDTSTILTIQLTEEEQRQLAELKSLGLSQQKPHYYVYCAEPCQSVRIGKLRVRCRACHQGAITLHSDPASWDDVLTPGKISATCESPGCVGMQAEFYFKCSEHETTGEDDTAVALYLVRVNLPNVQCLACGDISSPVVVFQCPSGHVVCLDCFVTYCVSRLNERQFVCDKDIGYTLPCPAGCGPSSYVREIHHFKLMGNHHYTRYQHFGAEELLLSMGGVLCPRPGCGQGILPDEDCRRVVCMNGCGYVFCKDCLQGYHIGECHPEDHPGDSRSTSSFFSLNPSRTDQGRWDEASTIAIRVLTKPCPKCRTPTERDGGCMHMVCTRASCTFHWCWVCQTEWTRECMAAHWFG